MRSTVVVTLLLLGLAELAPRSAVSAQSDQQRIDSLFMKLRPRQMVRLRLSGGEERTSTVSRIDSNPVRILLRDKLPDIDARKVDTMRVRIGTYAKPVAWVTAGVFGVGLGIASSALSCAMADCYGNAKSEGFVFGAVHGVALGALTGILIGKQIPRWRVEFGRAHRR